MTRMMPLSLALAAGTLMAACSTISANPADPSNPGDVTLPEAPENPDGDEPGAEAPQTPGADRSLSQGERDALATALGEVGMLSAYVDGMGDVDEVGTLTVTTNFANPAPTTTSTTASAATMDSFAFQVSITDGTDVYTETALIAWSGLDEAAETVDELLFVVATDLLDAGSADIGSIIGFGDPANGSTSFMGFAIQIDNINGTSLISESGTFDIDSITLDPAVDCDVLPAGAATCTEAEGDLEGSLDMDAYEAPVDSDGVIVIDVSADDDLANFTADFDVPVTRTTITR